MRMFIKWQQKHRGEIVPVIKHACCGVMECMHTVQDAHEVH